MYVRIILNRYFIRNITIGDMWRKSGGGGEEGVGGVARVNRGEIMWDRVREHYSYGQP